MKLNLKSLQDKKPWQEAGFDLPKYDLERVRQNTKDQPMWLHFGPGNIFRALMANAQQKLLNQGVSETGIIAVGSDSVETIYQKHDNLTVLVTLKVDGSIEKTVIGSIAETLILDPERTDDLKRLKNIICDPHLQMISFTITEKGYNLRDSKNEFLPEVQEDFESGPAGATSYFGRITSLLYDRFQAGEYPIALVSMDNVSQNGKILGEVVATFAKEWSNNHQVPASFYSYVTNPNIIAFPWSMIDKITPRPDESVRQMLKDSGLEGVEDLVTARGSYVSPFVNAEESEYLVIEDRFPNGRPPLEKAGLIFTDRETVEQVERMKVTTCLNPLHTTLAIFGCLLGFNLISEEMKDPDLKQLVEKIGYEEGFPVVVHPGIIDPKDFIKEVLEVRFPNPFMPDSPQRIATDTSQKLAIRFGETIKAYANSESLDVTDLKLIPLVIAGWLRYLMGIDDQGKEMALSPDPLLDELTSYVKNIKLGDKGPFSEQLQPILSNKAIFGVNLYDVGLGSKVENYFTDMVSQEGAVRLTLQKQLE